MSAPSIPLLDTIVRDALDPSYAAVASRKRSGQGDGDRRPAHPSRTKVTGAALMVVAGAVAGIAVSFQHKVLPQVGAARSALAGDADARARQVKTLQQALDDRQREVAALQQQQLQATSTGRLLQRRSVDLTAAIAQTPVNGPGLTITVTDVKGSGEATDRDLQGVVNALWAGGAEAVAVSGVRLGPQTAIRTAGQTILVNFRAVRSPYVIAAIAGPTLPAAIGHSSALAVLRQGAVGTHPDVVIRTSDSISLPGASTPAPEAAHPLSPGGHS